MLAQVSVPTEHKHRNKRSSSQQDKDAVAVVVPERATIVKRHKFLAAEQAQQQQDEEMDMARRCRLNAKVSLATTTTNAHDHQRIERRYAVTTIRGIHKLIDWKHQPGFWNPMPLANKHFLVETNVHTTGRMNYYHHQLFYQHPRQEEEELLPVPDPSTWISTAEVLRQFKLKVSDMVRTGVRFQFDHDSGEFYWEPSGVRAQAANAQRVKDMDVLLQVKARIAKLNFLLQENGVFDFERMVHQSQHLITEACEDYLDFSIKKPKLSQVQVLKNLIGLSQLVRVFPFKLQRPSVLRQYVMDRVFVLDEQGYIVDTQIKTVQEATVFVHANIQRSKLVLHALVKAALPIGEMLGDPTALVKAFSHLDPMFAEAFRTVTSPGAVEGIIYNRLARRLPNTQNAISQIALPRQRAIQLIINNAARAPCSKHVGIDRAVKEIEFALTSSVQTRTQVLMEFLESAFENVDEDTEVLFEKLPFLKEYCEGTFGGGLFECEACVPLAMVLNEAECYESYFEHFRQNLVTKVCRGYTWQRALKSVMAMKMARNLPFTLADVYASL